MLRQTGANLSSLLREFLYIFFTKSFSLYIFHSTSHPYFDRGKYADFDGKFIRCECFHKDKLKEILTLRK